MMNNNKILTVSYGTFSCTLEGFDDSFGTMKAITEYFRDLASDDRYFGSEPVQPDAGMLAKIAQKEISRHVEAREHEGNIVLSATQDDTYLAAPATAAVALAPEIKEDVVEVAKTQDADASIAQAMMHEDAADEAVADEDAVEDIIPEVEAEAEVTAELDTPPAPIGAPANEDYLDSPSADIEADPSIAVLRRAQSTATSRSDVDIVPDRDDAAVSSFFAQSAPTEDHFEEADVTAPAAEAAEAVAEVELPEIAKVEAPKAVEAPVVAALAVAPTQTESIADKLKRIREVVAQNGNEEAPKANDAPTVVETAQDAVEADLDDVEGEDAGQDDVISSALRDIKGAMAADDEAVNEVSADTPEEALDDDQDLTGILDRLKMGDDDAPVEKVTETDAEIEAEAEEAPEEEAKPALNAAALAAAATAAAASQDTQDAPVEPRRARVIKVKRVDLEAAIKDGDLEEYDDTAKAAQPAKRVSSLSDEEEAELADELAELEADLELGGDLAQQDEAEAQTEEDEDLAGVAREALPSLDEAQNPDMNRLMAETDQQMSEPENETRRNAFAHLRAAVAAKKADSGLGKDQNDAAEGEAYREDLAEVVRPRRPVAGEQRTPRPSTARPAPLKLVAEQRINDDKPAEAVTPVRPRRVAAVQEEAEVQAEESFAEFAAEAGATSLPDLLEAAAAYMSFVEGRAQFSRPQLMNKVRQVEENGFTREDSLRLFGKLLRDGKIEKTNAGRFQVSDQIGFKPDARAVG